MGGEQPSVGKGESPSALGRARVRRSASRSSGITAASPDKRAILKARIAETIVSEMLQEAGYFVYRFGYEGLLQSLVQRGLPQMQPGDIEAEKVRSMPDFIIMDRAGDVSFVEVKFRSQRDLDASLRDWIGRALRYWPEAKLILVHPSAPHFVISGVRGLARTGRLLALEEDRYIRVPRSIVRKYEPLVLEYLGVPA